MTARTKIYVYAGMLSMEFDDNLVQFNIFEAIKHPIEDHSLFGIDVIDKIVAEDLQLEVDSTEFPNFAKDIDARKPRVSRPKMSILAQKKRSRPEPISAAEITPTNKEQCHGGTRSFNKVSLSIEVVQDQDLGSWKLSEVIPQYS
ncbi:hypothetical protein CR513_59845, partial [Mucuna pruriens]